jgi:hypothetical protein
MLAASLDAGASSQTHTGCAGCRLLATGPTHSNERAGVSSDEEENDADSLLPALESSPATYVQMPYSPHLHLDDPDPVEFMQLCVAHPELVTDAPIEVRASSRLCRVGKPCQLGVFATEHIHAGRVICFYSDHLMHQSRNQYASHAVHLPGTDFLLDGGPCSSMFTRFIANDHSGLEAICALPASAFLPQSEVIGSSAMARFLAAPKGFMINSFRQGEHENGGRVAANVSRRLKKFTPCVPQLDEGRMCVYQATCAIERGTELLTRYNNSEEKHGF